MSAERAVLFIDGSNFYHAARGVGVAAGNLDYRTLARRLILDRELTGIRYYVGRVSGDLHRIASQSKFLDRLRSQGVEITLGRIERTVLTPDRNPLARRLKPLLAIIREESSHPVLAELEALVETRFPRYTEKRVDVSIAVDMVRMAHEGMYDVAYLLSADSDLVPAVEAVRSRGKKVFAASPAFGHELEKVVDAFISLRRGWFSGLSL